MTRDNLQQDTHLMKVKHQNKHHIRHRMKLIFRSCWEMAEAKAKQTNVIFGQTGSMRRDCKTCSEQPPFMLRAGHTEVMSAQRLAHGVPAACCC